MTLAEQMKLQREMQEAEEMGQAHLGRGRTPEAIASFAKAREIKMKLMRHRRARYGRPGR